MSILTGQTKLEHKRAWALALLERRSKPRYPIAQDLVFRRRGRHREVLTTPGKTLNMSSRGILFEAESNLIPGELLQLAIQWPVMLEHRCGLKLVVVGRVVRCTAGQAAVRILQYEFKTVGRNGLTL